MYPPERPMLVRDNCLETKYKMVSKSDGATSTTAILILYRLIAHPAIKIDVATPATG